MTHKIRISESLVKRIIKESTLMVLSEIKARKRYNIDRIVNEGMEMIMGTYEEPADESEETYRYSWRISDDDYGVVKTSIDDYYQDFDSCDMAFSEGLKELESYKEKSEGGKEYTLDVYGINSNGYSVPVECRTATCVDGVIIEDEYGDNEEE